MERIGIRDQKEEMKQERGLVSTDDESSPC